LRKKVGQRQNCNPTKHTIVMVRHGESEWNKLNYFTGWYDCGLSDVGKIEAASAGKAIKGNFWEKCVFILYCIPASF